MDGEARKKFKVELRDMIRSRLGSLPEEYTERYQMLQQARQIFQVELAAALQPSLNQFLATPLIGERDDSYQGRREMASLINNRLWVLGLAPKDPLSENPAYLTVSPADSRRTKACPVYLKVREGHPRTPVSEFDKWPELQLIDDPPKYQHADRWFSVAPVPKHR